MTRTMTSRRAALRPSRILVAGAEAALVLSGCANSGEDDSAGGSASAGSGAAQQTKENTSSGEGCTLDAYGVKKVDLKGAVVGGVAGHVAGHGVLGAAAGCAVGRHQANKRDRQQQTPPPAR